MQCHISLYTCTSQANNTQTYTYKIEKINRYIHTYTKYIQDTRYKIQDTRYKIQDTLFQARSP